MKCRKKYLFVILLIVIIELIEHIKSYGIFDGTTVSISLIHTTEAKQAARKNCANMAKPEDVKLNFFETSPYAVETMPTETHSDGNEKDDSTLPYLSLPHFKISNLDRYFQYKKNNPELTYEQVVTHVNIGIDLDFYEMVKIIEVADSITVLVNKYNRLPEDYKPDLVQLDSSMCAPGRGKYLRKEAAEAFAALHRDTTELG